MNRNAAVVCLIVGFVLFTVPCMAQPPDTLWTQTYGGTSIDLGASVQQTADGGYIIAGSSRSFGPGNFDVWLLRVDSSGNEIWSQFFGLPISQEYGESVQQTADGGFIILARTESLGASPDVWLIKTDSSGNEVWNQTIEGDDEDCGYCIKQIADGGYIITGKTRSYGSTSNDLWLLKLDSDGNVVWNRTFGLGDDLDDYGRDVQLTTDGGYIIAGYTDSYGAGSSDVWLIKTDSSGNEMWSQTFGGIDDDSGFSVKQTADGGYVITGYTRSYGAGASNVWLIKTDSNGNEMWNQTFGEAGSEAGNCVVPTTDGGYFISGYSNSFGIGPYDAWFIKTDFMGNEEWSQTFGGIDDDYGAEVQQTTSGDFIIIGGTDSFGAGNTDLWLILLEEGEHISPVDLSLTPHNLPIEVPAEGGPFFWDIEIANILDNQITGQLWAEVILPSGYTFTGDPLLMVNNLTLWPGYTLTATNLVQYVPDFAPIGNYTYIVKTGFLPNFAVAQDSFEFEKLDWPSGASRENMGWTTSGWVSEEDQPVATLPSEYALEAPYPNPFNPTTTVSIALPTPSDLRISVFNTVGQEVAVLANGQHSAGHHTFTFDATGLSSGIYFVQANVPGQLNELRKIVLLK
jgi:Secretion system C-terminal sorting domain